MMAIIRAAAPDVCTRFLRGHPALSPKALGDPALTDASRSEQSGLGMSSLGDNLSRFEAASTAYEARFGLPFIVCVRRLTPRFVLRNLTSRLANTAEQEREAALNEIGYITRLRLVDRVSGPGMPRTAGHFSTHVLDTARGRAAEGVQVKLLREDILIAEAVTDRDGRAGAALLRKDPCGLQRCRGLAEGDPDQLTKAVAHYRRVGRPVEFGAGAGRSRRAAGPVRPPPRR